MSLIREKTIVIMMNSVWSAWGNAIELVLNGKLTSQKAMDDAVGQIKTAIEKSRKK